MSPVWRSTRENSLNSDTKFHPGIALTSPNGEYELLLTPGGNLQIRDQHQEVMWESGSSSTIDCYGLVRDDGKLVVRTADQVMRPLLLSAYQLCLVGK